MILKKVLQLRWIVVSETVAPESQAVLVGPYPKEDWVSEKVERQVRAEVKGFARKKTGV